MDVLLQNEKAMLNTDLSVGFPDNGIVASLIKVTLEFIDGSKSSAVQLAPESFQVSESPDRACCKAHAGPVAVVASWHLPQRRSHVDLLLSLESHSPGPLRLTRLTWELRLDVRNAGGFPPSEISWFRNGWQSWSFAGMVSAANVSFPAPRLPFAYGIKEDPSVPRNESAQTSDMVTAIKLGENAMAVGAIRQQFFQRIFIDPAPPHVHLSLSIDLDGEPLPVGRSLVLGGWQFEGARTATPLVRHWGERNACRTAHAPLRGWCSWYDRYRKITADYILSTARKMASQKRFRELSAVIIDDGYQDRVGDWLEPSARFGLPIADVAKAITAMGKRPGIWTAPFILQSRSRLFAKHPEWLLRVRGRPLRIGWNPHWRDSFYALDVNNPDFIAHITETFGQLYAAGFRIFKLDYLFAGALRGDRDYHANGRFGAFANALDSIRGATGPDAFLIGCGSPLAPAAGRVDAMRVSTDTSYSWLAPRPFQWVTGDSELTGLYPSLRNTMARGSFAQHFWQLDPDCLLLRQRKGSDSASEKEALLAAALISHLGETMLLGDDLDKWTPREERFLDELMQSTGSNFWPLDSLDVNPPEWGIFDHGGSTFAAVYNLGEARKMASLSLPRLSDRMTIRSASTVTGQPVEVNEERVSIRDIDRHTHAVVQVSSRSSRVPSPTG
jgi:alpha-galactosidase